MNLYFYYICGGWIRKLVDGWMLVNLNEIVKVLSVKREICSLGYFLE